MRFVQELKARVLAGCLLIAAMSAVGAQFLLQTTFAAAHHPASLAAANTEPDPEVIRGWYAQMADRGTLDWMVRTEIVDYLWIATLAATFILITLLSARLLTRRNPWASLLLYRIAPFAALGPGLDAAENAVSLLMLANPVDFPDVLAPVHAWISWAKLAASLAMGTALPAFVVIAAATGHGGSTGKGYHTFKGTSHGSPA